MSESNMGQRLRPAPHIIGTVILLAALLSGCQSPESSSGDKVAAVPKSGTGAPPKVLGLKPHDVEELLGMPKLVRRDDPAEVWQYRSSACVLDVFLYPVETGAQQVRYLEARTVAAEPARTDECVNDIRRTNRLPT
ncbi:MAG: hypothetical protein ACKVOI_03925 [Dongiaceae bacterium]